MGMDGYVNATKEIVSTARKIDLGIRNIPGLYVLGNPLASVVSFGSTNLNIYSITDAMKACGWSLNALQFPSSAHICVTRRHTKQGVVEKFLDDLRKCVDEVAMNPKSSEVGMAAIYGLAQSIPDRSIVTEMAWTYLDACTSLPERKLE